jgi:RNA polymerase sigma-70 factor (ECF subfamily)
MHRFLAEIECRAFRIAHIASGNRDDALEIVQEAMTRLAQRYGDHPRDAWLPLFHRILQSRIQDWRRRQWVRNRFRVWFHGDDGEEGSPLDAVPEQQSQEPSLALERDQFMARLDAELHALPYRQQQAFLLRVWEGMDIAATAQAMGCSESSVKTHYARARERLKQKLEDMV